MPVNKDKGYSSSGFISRLEADGWVLCKVEGNHHQFKHPEKKGKVTMRHPDKNVPAPTARAIEGQAGL
jgi:predicted RNA binding protein YcfA (HicA-like mRNA interferase family)